MHFDFYSPKTKEKVLKLISGDPPPVLPLFVGYFSIKHTHYYTPFSDWLVGSPNGLQFKSIIIIVAVAILSEEFFFHNLPCCFCFPFDFLQTNPPNAATSWRLL